MEDRATDMYPEDDLQMLIEEEKRALARAYAIEGWESGIEEGIDPDMLARNMVRAILEAAEAETGGMTAGRIIAEMQEAEHAGDFLRHRTVQ